MVEESIIYLMKDEDEDLIDLTKKITVNPSDHPELFCQQSKDMSKYIPERIQEILFQFSNHGSSEGFLLIQGIRINDRIQTPSTNKNQVGEKTQLAKIQSILINKMGEMISYEAEGYGHLFQDLVPVQHMEHEQTSYSSHVELEIHTEQAFSTLRPDILSLACIRGDKNAFTYILPVKRILMNLSTYEMKLLRQPLWKIGVDMSFKLNGHDFIYGDLRGPIPILYGSKEDPLLVFDQDLMIGITEESHQMIQKIVDIYYKSRISHNLQEGEIIFIDNRRSVHGRSPFSPRYDGDDRFLIRCFSIQNYKSTEYARKGRMIQAIYS